MTDYASILQNISKHISLNSAETKLFTARLTSRTIQKKEVILKAGEICSHINYVENGVLRAYYSDQQGNENIIMFAIHDWWITDMYSFATRNVALFHIDALEESSIIQLDKKDLDDLYQSVPKFERFFRIIIQNAYIREQLRIVENLSLSASQRYENFINKYPKFVEQIPLKQIASYLGITPEFLSVIRKKSRLE
jgi:CRP-like cAMP-binding protein